jgi:hypothetical protein
MGIMGQSKKKKILFGKHPFIKRSFYISEKKNTHRKRKSDQDPSRKIIVGPSA